MYSIVSTAIIHGIQSVPISVEADVSDGLPVFEMVGFLASEVQEAKERVRTALKNSGYALPPKHITINFTPANIRKSGSGFDLPVAVAVLTAFGHIGQETVGEYFVVGEVGLNGKVQSVNGILPMVEEAKERGMKKCVVPWENAREAALVSDMQVYAVKNIAEAVRVLNGSGDSFNVPYNIEEMQTKEILDFADVSGQTLVKRACETAVSGMHNLLFIGPPGAGKTMIAERIPGILPPLNTKERMEISKIYSVCGLLEHKKGLIQERPFRTPHHTITPQGLAGGGALPKPGEISLAHKGILFLDELTEFQRETLEILRQPMEEKKICIARLHASYEYPADFMLVAAMNPCKCGYYPDMQKCTCTSAAVDRYLRKVSRPLLDRIDVCVEVPSIRFQDLYNTGKGENSCKIRERVMRTQKIQKERYRGENFCFNSHIPSSKIFEYCKLDEKQKIYMEQMYNKLNLTARTCHKILRVARTLADMDECEQIKMRHLNEAICYRNIDRKFWEGMG